MVDENNDSTTTKGVHLIGKFDVKFLFQSHPYRDQNFRLTKLGKPGTKCPQAQRKVVKRLLDYVFGFQVRTNSRFVGITNHPHLWLSEKKKWQNSGWTANIAWKSSFFWTLADLKSVFNKNREGELINCHFFEVNGIVILLMVQKSIKLTSWGW